MNMQEMATADQYRLPVKIFLLNNEHLGMVRQLQYVDYGQRYAASYSDSLPDFVGVAQAYGWHGIRITDPADLDSGVGAMLDHAGPVLVEVRVSRLDNCYPMVPSGAAHTQMLLSPETGPSPSQRRPARCCETPPFSVEIKTAP